MIRHKITKKSLFLSFISFLITKCSPSEITANNNDTKPTSRTIREPIVPSQSSITDDQIQVAKRFVLEKQDFKLCDLQETFGKPVTSTNELLSMKLTNKEGNFIMHVYPLSSQNNADPLSNTLPKLEYHLKYNPRDPNLPQKFQLENQRYIVLKNAQLPDETRYICEFDFMSGVSRELPIELTIVKTPILEIITQENLQYRPWKIQSTKKTKADDLGQNKKFDVARCSSKDARPAARLEFVFEGYSDNPQKRKEIGWEVIRRYDISPNSYTNHLELKMKITPEMNMRNLICKVVGHPAEKLNATFAEVGKQLYHQLEIDYPPQNVQINAESGDELKCSADGNPPPKYNWYYDDKQNSNNGNFDHSKLEFLVTEKPTFSFANSTRERNATIWCYAHNNLNAWPSGKSYKTAKQTHTSANPAVLFEAYNWNMEQQRLAQSSSSPVVILIILVIIILSIVVGFIVWKNPFNFGGNKGKGQQLNDSTNEHYETDPTSDIEKVQLQPNDNNIQIIQANNNNINNSQNEQTNLIVDAGQIISSGNNSMDRRILEHNQQMVAERGQEGYEQPTGGMSPPTAEYNNLETTPKPVEQKTPDDIYFDDPDKRPT